MEFHKYIKPEFLEDKRPTPGGLAQEVLEEAGKRLHRGDTGEYLRIKGELDQIYNDVVDPAIEDAMKAGLDTRSLQIQEASRRIEQLFVKYCTKSNG